MTATPAAPILAYNNAIATLARTTVLHPVASHDTFTAQTGRPVSPE